MPQDRIEQAKREAITLYQEGVRAQTLGDYPKAEDAYRRCHGIMKAIGDHNGEAAALHYLGTLLEARFDMDEARDCYEESYRLFGQDDDLQNCLFSLFFQAMLALKIKSYAHSLEVLTESLGLSFQLGPTFVQEAWSRIRQMSGVMFAGRKMKELIALGENLEEIGRSSYEDRSQLNLTPTVARLAQLTQQIGVFLIGCGRLWLPEKEENDLPHEEFIRWLLQTAVNLDQATGTGLAFTDLASKVIQEKEQEGN